MASIRTVATVRVVCSVSASGRVSWRLIRTVFWTKSGQPRSAQDLASADDYEKPGGHGERSVAVGTIDMAVWDAVAKIEEKPLFQLLAERYGTGTANRKVFVYAAGGYYWPGQGIDGLVKEMRSYLERGYSVVKKKIGGASLSEDRKRIEAVLKLLGGVRSLRSTPMDASTEDRDRIRESTVEYDLFWYEEPGDPLDYALQAELPSTTRAQWPPAKSVLDAGCPQLDSIRGMRPDRDWLQFDCALSYGWSNTCAH